MNKRFVDTANYDPGRFKYSLNFFKQTTVIQPNGDQVVTNVFVKTMRAVRENVSRRVGLSLEGYLKDFGDASELLGAWVFTIRTSADFTPTKDMIFICQGVAYTSRIIQEVNQPGVYIKMLAVSTDALITT